MDLNRPRSIVCLLLVVFRYPSAMHSVVFFEFYGVTLYEWYTQGWLSECFSFRLEH